jgi:carboxyl-terminal processing protease
LINENSASASEVFASGMKEHGGYTLVGTTSFGKGTMQTDKLISATVGDQLHITIGKWTTADGGWVHYDGGTDGITPDIIVEQNDYEIAYKTFLLDESPIEFDTVDSRTANVQVILNLMGYDVRTDGYFDTETLSAVEDIQTSNGLTVNGSLDEDTLTIINAALDAYQTDYANDSQLQAALIYLSENPNDPNE